MVVEIPDVKKKWSFSFTFGTCLAWCVIHTLCRSILEPGAKPSHVAAHVKSLEP